MRRTKLVAYRTTQVTPDVAEALRHLEMRAVEVGNVGVVYGGPAAKDISWDGVQSDRGPLDLPEPLSMRPTGREVYLRVAFRDFKGSGEERRHREVETMWGLAVPLGFVPWNRYPLPNNQDAVFHYFGPWRQVYDHLCGEGRGDEAWPSLVCAAQLDVGTWEGDRTIERTVQAHLHRLGIPCGPVDGIIGDRTVTALRTLGLRGMRLDETAAHLCKMEPPQATEEQRRIGHVVIPGRRVTAITAGNVATTATPQGFAVTIDGPGRLILDIGSLK